MTENKEIRIGQREKSNCHIDLAKSWPTQLESPAVSIVYQRVMRWAKMVKPLFSNLAQLLDVGFPRKGQGVCVGGTLGEVACCS